MVLDIKCCLFIGLVQCLSMSLLACVQTLLAEEDGRKEAVWFQHL